jgi:hypothetical protein
MESRAAARVPVELGQDHTGGSQPLVEVLGAAHGVLADHGIGHQEHFAGAQAGAQIADFLHHLFIDVQAPGSVHDQHIMPAVRRVLARRQRQIEGRINSQPSKAGNLDGLGDHGELFARCGTVNVR